MNLVISQNLLLPQLKVQQIFQKTVELLGLLKSVRSPLKSFQEV